MFDQTNTSVARTTRESAFKSSRDATAVRKADADRYVFKTATDTSAEKSGERSWRDNFAVAVGLLLMFAIVLSGLEVCAHLWANTGMVR